MIFTTSPQNTYLSSVTYKLASKITNIKLIET